MLRRQAWFTAALSRARTLPPLERFAADHGAPSRPPEPGALAAKIHQWHGRATAAASRR